MKTVAQLTVQYLLFLFCADEEVLDSDISVKIIEDVYETLKGATVEERAAISTAAKETLDFILREPDEYGFSTRGLVTDAEKELLGSLVTGEFYSGIA